jgi:predicted transcriptional regulator
MPNAWKVERLSPLHLEIIRRHFNFESGSEIALALGITQCLVSNVLNSEQGLEVVEQLWSRKFDSMLEVGQQLQAVAPYIVQEKIKLALTARDERVKNTACTDILHMAGHVPVRRVEIDDLRPDSKFSGKSEEEMRAMILEELDTVLEAKGKAVDTVH